MSPLFKYNKKQKKWRLNDCHGWSCNGGCTHGVATGITNRW